MLANGTCYTSVIVIVFVVAAVIQLWVNKELTQEALKIVNHQVGKAGRGLASI